MKLYRTKTEESPILKAETSTEESQLPEVPGKGVLTDEEYKKKQLEELARLEAEKKKKEQELRDLEIRM